MQYTIEQLRSFIAAADHGSFSAAGRFLGRAQSLISNHISLLEEELGIQLFDRSGKHPVLTAPGKLLIDQAHEIIRHCQLFTASAASIVTNVDESYLNIAVDEALPWRDVHKCLMDISSKYPFIRVQILFGSTAELWELMEDGKIDSCITFELTSKYLAKIYKNHLGMSNKRYLWQKAILWQSISE